jgi:4-diphosphocytidyl-2-C-methyl-D-erythritol kinase
LHNKQFHRFSSPAKLNLFLHIVGQRADGYHELETIFQFLNYGDSIEIKTTNSNDIELLTPIEGVKNQDNLIVKAATLLQKKVVEKKTRNTKFGAQIKVNKILPMGGGLGGGSSNAATVLLALNSLWQTNLSTNELAELGVTLGADVPIFIHGFAAFAQGIGEKLTPVTPKEYWYLVSKPDCSISTAAVFSASDLPRNTEKLSSENINIEQCHNDCQTLVIKQYPKVAKLLSWLLEYAPSRMTGTGACIFTQFSSENEAKAIQQKLPSGIESFVTKGINQSPLVAEIAATEQRLNA